MQTPALQLNTCTAFVQNDNNNNNIIVIIYMIYEKALYINKFKVRVESFVTQETQLKFTFCFSIIFFQREK